MMRKYEGDTVPLEHRNDMIIKALTTMAENPRSGWTTVRSGECLILVVRNELGIEVFDCNVVRIKNSE